MVRLNWNTIQPNRPPRAWTTRLKWMANECVFRLLKRRPFRIFNREHFSVPDWQQQMENRWRVFSRETNFPAALLLLAFCLALTIGWKLADRSTQISDLWPEMGGVTLDVFFILIVFAWFEHNRSRRQEIERQLEIIDDLKSWDSPEAHQRIAGAIRRLNRKGIFALDLRGATISDFSFARNRIANISYSIFYDGNWGVPTNETSVSLTRVDFGSTDCSGVQFSPYDPFEALNFGMHRHARLIDCGFIGTNLGGAKFNGAAMLWTDAPPISHLAIEEDDEGGPPRFEPLSYAPFHNANLSGASFRACIFENADFRGAEGLEGADFFRAQGLDQACFDSVFLKERALASATRPDADVVT